MKELGWLLLRQYWFFLRWLQKWFQIHIDKVEDSLNGGPIRRRKSAKRWWL